MNRKSIDAIPDMYLAGDDGITMFGADNVVCGHVNDDTYGDFLIAGVCYPKGQRRGRMYLFFGSRRSEMDTVCDMIFTGENDLDRFGHDGSLGDINGDDFTDILIGARLFKGESFQVRAYLYCGGPSRAEPDRQSSCSFCEDRKRTMQ